MMISTTVGCARVDAQRAPGGVPAVAPRGGNVPAPRCLRPDPPRSGRLSHNFSARPSECHCGAPLSRGNAYAPVGSTGRRTEDGGVEMRDDKVRDADAHERTKKTGSRSEGAPPARACSNREIADALFAAFRDLASFAHGPESERDA